MNTRTRLLPLFICLLSGLSSLVFCIPGKDLKEPLLSINSGEVSLTINSGPDQEDSGSDSGSDEENEPVRPRYLDRIQLPTLSRLRLVAGSLLLAGFAAFIWFNRSVSCAGIPADNHPYFECVNGTHWRITPP